MKSKKIEKTIDIQASPENVWQIFTADNYTRQWYSEFCPGTFVETDWAEGSKAIFKVESGNGMITKIITNKPAELLVIEYTGNLVKNVEDYDSDVAQQIKGGQEVYILTKTNSGTQVHIRADMGEQYYDMMNTAWDKAIEKIKTLAEGLQA